MPRTDATDSVAAVRYGGAVPGDPPDLTCAVRRT